jgi:L-lactate dehydrogenase (cytochrome)
MNFNKINPVTVDDYRQLAKKCLPRFLYDYVDGGANGEQTMRRNIADFAPITLKQRVMRDVSSIDTSTTMAGQRCSMPLALAPVGMAGMYARRGEVQAARAAQKAGIAFALSTVGICPVEEVNGAVQQPAWFQLYMLRDREVVLAILERASAAGCNTLVFTVDLPVPGLRLRDFRNGMVGTDFKSALARASALAKRPAWLWDVGLGGRPHTLGNLGKLVDSPNSLAAYKQFIGEQFDPAATWKDIAWLRSAWNGKIIIKGILEADDARAAVDAGADGILVSNHGGRQMDGVASSIRKLPAVASAVGNQSEVFLDGGVRNGIDVLKALALGAKGVLIGRPWIYAMAARGEAGVTSLLSLFQQEIAVGMALMGVHRIDEITGELLDKSDLA